MVSIKADRTSTASITNTSSSIHSNQYTITNTSSGIHRNHYYIPNVQKRKIEPEKVKRTRLALERNRASWLVFNEKTPNIKQIFKPIGHKNSYKK